MEMGYDWDESKSEKLFGIITDKNLSFSDHKTWLEAGEKSNSIG